MIPVKIKRKLSNCSKDELIELLYETVKVNKDAQAYVSIKLEGELVLLEIINASKERIYKEFYPTRGFPKLRVSTVEQTLEKLKTIGKGTILPFELLVYFCEMAVQYIHEQSDIFEDMGDYFTDAYEEVIQILNKEKTTDLFEHYKDRVKAIVQIPGCECWGIHDSLAGSYSDLKWIDHDEKEENSDLASGVIS